MRAKDIIQEIIGAEGGVPLINYRITTQKGAISTKLRKDFGHPTPFIRRRLIPVSDGTSKEIAMVFAYNRNGAPTEVLRALKDFADDGEVKQLVKRSAIYVASTISRFFKPDAVVPAPSRAGLAALFANELAIRLGNLPVLAPPQKVQSMVKIGYSQRAKAARGNFKVQDQPRMNGTILVVDDFCTTASTICGIAQNLYDYPDVTNVVGCALVIH